jgi:hypothetical protein
MKAVAIASAASFLIAGAAVAQPVYTDQPLNMEMTPGLVRILDVERDIGSVLIGDEEVADVVALTGTRISVTAYKPGETSLILLDANSDIIVATEIEVVASALKNRKLVTVRSFPAGPGGQYETHSYHCEKVGPRGFDTCVFTSSKGNVALRPIISTGPIVQDQTMNVINQVNNPQAAPAAPAGGSQ